MAEHDMPMIEFSENYNFFYDQFEKANLFLQAMIDTAKEPEESRTVEWLFAHPIQDGGQFTQYRRQPLEIWHSAEKRDGGDLHKRLQHAESSAVCSHAVCVRMV